MANHMGIAAVGRSIERYLNHCFGELDPITGSDAGSSPPGGESSTKALLVRTEEFENSSGTGGISIPCVTIFLYRVDYNTTMRAAWSQVGFHDGRAHLPVDLHFLLTPWGTNADHEMRIIGRVIQCLDENPILNGPMLDNLSNWTPHEGVQVCLEDLSTEDIMRIYDSLPVNFKLSVPYVARVLRVDGRRADAGVPTVTVTRGIKPESTP